MHSHQPDAAVICIDVTRLVELTVVQAGAQVSRHAFSVFAQVLPSRTETALLAHLLPPTACLGPRQTATRPVTHTPTGLVYLASWALHF